jgi:hypothetical protein
MGKLVIPMLFAKREKKSKRRQNKKMCIGPRIVSQKTDVCTVTYI